MDDMVHRRAMQAFLEEEVFLTRDRTGILIYISLHEHRVEILGDSGINAAVDPAEWASISDDLCRAIRAKDVVGGLINTIRRCGELLSAKGLAIKADDTNELGNGLRTRGFDWV
jgi:putative membrane protein